MFKVNQAKDIVNRKAQALVEFVLIIPVIVMILFIIIDFSNVFYNKNMVENLTNTSAEYIIEGKTLEEVKQTLPNGVNITLVPYGNNRKIIVSKSINFVTPFAYSFFANPYTVSEERVILNE